MNSDLARLFLSPRSVAFVGAPSKSGPETLNPIDNLMEWGYEGKIQIVHPYAREIAGRPTLSNVGDLDRSVELGVISTPRETVPGIIEECVGAGIRALIVINQGFSDADSRGAELQQAMVDAAKQGGARILGPNTVGVSNGFDRFLSSFIPIEREEYPLGTICQSGTFLVGARYFTGGVGIGVDLGNTCDIDLADTLEWFGNDPRLRALAVHAEGIQGGQRFLETARAVSQRIPIVMLKTGRSPEGARAAASHTGSLTGEDRVADAAFKKAGVVRADTVEDFLDLSRGFVRLPPMRGRRVAVVTFTGGGGIAALDAMERWGLETASLADRTLDALRELSPPWMPLGNPMDVFPALMKHGLEMAYGAALRDAAQDPGVDGILCIVLGFRPGERKPLDATKLIAGVSLETEKPIVTWVYGPRVDEASAHLEEEGRAMAVPSPERAVRLLAKMAMYQRWREGRDT